MVLAHFISVASAICGAVRPGTDKRCLFVYLFVCCYKTRNSILCSLCLEESNNPWEWLHTDSGTFTCVRQRQLHRPRTCQSMANTLQVDGLVRISGLTQALYKTHPQPLNGVPPCLVWRIGFGQGGGVKPCTIWWWVEIVNCPPTKMPAFVWLFVSSLFVFPAVRALFWFFFFVEQKFSLWHRHWAPIQAPPTPIFSHHTHRPPPGGSCVCAYIRTFFRVGCV